MVKAMVGGCCVCSDERGWDENPLVYCDGHGCNVAVHQACYGIVQVPKGPWFCRKCESQERIARVKCELCPSKSGALKRTDTGGWAHVVCALYIPEVRFGNVTTMEPIILASVPHERYLKMCYICEERGKESKTAHGGCMNCNKQGCRQTFHVTCAQSCGFLCEENDGQSGPTVKYVGYCQFHWTKRTKGLLNNKTPEKEKEKLKLKLDKDREKEKEKKPKPRTNSESTSSPSISQPLKNDNLPKPPTSTAISTSVTAVSIPSTPTTTTLTPGMPKQRGRKPSTVKTLPPATNNNESSTKTPQPATTKESTSTSAPAKVVTTPSVTVMSPTISTPLTTPVDVTTLSSVPTETSVQNSKNILSSQSTAQPTPKSPAINVSMPKTSQAKPVAKATVVNKKPANQVKQPPKKRPSSKSDDEPKRKVGRPPLKSKTPESKSRPRPASASKPSRPKAQNKSKNETSPMTVVTSSPTTSLPGYSVHMNSMSTASPVPMHHSLPPTSSHGVNPYVIPQPRLAGHLDSGHRMQEQPHQQTNGPLQLPNSLEQLLEYQWEQGAQFLMQQASQYDVASLMSSLHQLKADNSRLENRLESLLARRSQLLQVSSRLSASMSCTSTNTSSTATDVSNKEPAGTKVTPSSTQPITTVSMNTQSSRLTTSAGIKTASSVANVEIVGSKNNSPRVSATLSFPPSNASSLENKNFTGKGKTDKGKSPPVKLPISSPTASLPTTQNATVPKMVTPKSVGLQPNQIKITMLQPHTTQSNTDKDKSKTTATAAPIAILPTALQNSLSSQLLQNQQLQVLQAQAKQAQGKNKQPLILPHQAVTSQAFTTQQFPQQQQQFVLLMQQQQQQQQLQQLQRQGQSGLFRTDQSGPNQLVSTQSKNAASVHSQKFVPSAMQLGYPGGFVAFSDGIGMSTGQHIDVSKATAFATLPLVQLDKSKGLEHSDKNGTTLPSDKSMKKS